MGSASKGEPDRHLPEAYWRMRLGELSDACRASSPAGEADGLREAYDLLALAPDGANPGGAPRISEDEFEAMLGAKAAESAALALLPPGAGYMLSRGPSRRCLATVSLPRGAGECTAEADTPALAIVAALLEALEQPGGESAPRQWLG